MNTVFLDTTNLCTFNKIFNSILMHKNEIMIEQ